MNKMRILKLIDILRHMSDMDHKLSLSEIASLLEQEGVRVSDRKTLYDDLQTLDEYGYETEYDKGYYLSEAPFSISEIKIIIDSLNSLKNLDESFLNELKRKLYSFISTYETKELKKLEYRGKHKDTRFINRLEDALQAIISNRALIIQRKNNKDSETIFPVFLYRQNDYYYLYYHYESHDKIYHARFDNITSMKLTDKENDITIAKQQIISNIEESTNAFYSTKAKLIRIDIIQDSEYLRSRLNDDFVNIVFGKTSFSLKASISDALFAKLASYGDQIKISDPKIADQYISFLNKIIIRNTADHNSN